MQNFLELEMSSACFFYHRRSEQKTVRESARATIKKVHEAWSSIKIPAVQEIRSIEKIEKLFAEWKVLLKNKSRTSNVYTTFSANLDLLFDITTKDAVHLVEAEIAAGPSADRKTVLEDSLEHYRGQLKSRVLRKKNDQATKC